MKLITFKNRCTAQVLACVAGLVGLSALGSASQDSRLQGIRLHAGVNPATELRSSTWREAKLEVAGLVPAPQALVVRGRSEHQKVVALTFDDGPHPDSTPTLVRELSEADAPATFFVIGKQVDRYPDMVKLEADHGFEIGNHSYSHVTLTKLPTSDVLTEFRACNDAIVRAGGPEPRFGRPPGGDLNRQVERSATANGLRTTLWTDDPGDYASPGQNVILRETLSHLTDGGIILLHDGTAQTAQILPKLIEEIRARGYKIVPLSELAVSRA
jgi:peptidoglycan/xylan/chitin deacetylase (PgdA/CDA1 family)